MAVNHIGKLWISCTKMPSNVSRHVQVVTRKITDCSSERCIFLKQTSVSGKFQIVPNLPNFLQARPFSQIAEMQSTSDKKLFTPGPLTCSFTVKEAMLRDVGSRDNEFITIVKLIRTKLLDIAGVSPIDYASVLLQGSGTYCVEAVLQTVTPRKGGKIIIFSNGSYGQRMKKICEKAAIDADVVEFPEDQFVQLSEVEKALNSGTRYDLVAAVHCETSSGVINDVDGIGKLVKKYQPSASFFVDAMSSFGAVPLNLLKSNIDFVVSSANKCLQGVPGFAFVVAKRDKIEKCKGNSRSLSLDLVEQLEGLETTGQFRFTPPTHALLAFRQALEEFEEEGGHAGRAKRYQQNCSTLQKGMKMLGFKTLLPADCRSYVITSYYYPEHPNFNFNYFYERLSDQGQVIYPGKVTNANCFRIGNIGNLFPEDIKKLLQCIESVLVEMGVPVPVS